MRMQDRNSLFVDNLQVVCGLPEAAKITFYLKENIFAIKTFEKYKDLNLYDLNHTNLYFLS